MGRTRVHIDNAALQRAIRTGPGVKAALQRAVDETADHVREQGITVGDRNGGPDEIALPVVAVVDSEGTGLVGKVILAHPAGLAVQAKHGSLTAAASRAGLKLKGGGGL